jgi:hypothetical protein
LDEVERSNKVSERSWADVIGSVASIVDALACLTFLILPADVDIPFPENLRDPVDTHPAAVSFQDFFLILSQSVDLGLLSITAAFRAARNLKKILGSGFEMITISQCESPRVFGFMIKK